MSKKEERDKIRTMLTQDALYPKPYYMKNGKK